MGSQMVYLKMTRWGRQSLLFNTAYIYAIKNNFYFRRRDSCAAGGVSECSNVPGIEYENFRVEHGNVNM